jgi:hypothetical protein
MARIFFDKWFAAINVDSGLPRVYDKKLTIIALCTLMEMDPAGIPEGLKEGWPGIVAGVLKVFKDLPRAIAGKHLSYLNCSVLIGVISTEGYGRCI